MWAWIYSHRLKEEILVFTNVWKGDPVASVKIKFKFDLTNLILETEATIRIHVMKPLSEHFL